MDMKVTQAGIFDLQISAEDLSTGLRKVVSTKSNTPGLVACDGVVGREGVLQRIDELVSTFGLVSAFPFPQIFIEPDIILVCTKTSIYEYTSDTLILKLNVTGGSKWSLVSVGSFVYMSNGTVSVIHDPITRDFSVSEYPTATCICNYNGQIIIGAPNAGYNLGD